jgi:hypothetical protein
MRVRVIKYIHRKHNGWEFRAATARVEDEGKSKDIVFGITEENGVTRTGLEIYQGENYILDSPDRTRSWRYEEGSIPKKWQKLYEILEALHGATDWSKDVSVITTGLVNQYI